MTTKVQFEEVIAKMPVLLDKLNSSPARSREDLRDVPERGIYVFYEKKIPLYVGRSNRMRRRLKEHAQPSGQHFSATFAFLLALEKAKEDAKQWKVLKPLTRIQLQKNLSFRDIYLWAKNRVSNMDIRVIKVNDPIEQTVFEVYAALKLQTPYNSFENH